MASIPNVFSMMAHTDANYSEFENITQNFTPTYMDRNKQAFFLIAMSFVGGLGAGFILHFMYACLLRMFLGDYLEEETVDGHVNLSFIGDDFRPLNDNPPDYATVMAGSSADVSHASNSQDYWSFLKRFSFRKPKEPEVPPDEEAPPPSYSSVLASLELDLSMWTTPAPIKHTVADSLYDPLYNKYVVIGVLVFFVTILLLIILAYVIRYLHHRETFQNLSHMARNDDTRPLEDPGLEGEEDDDDLVDLYTSCRLYVEDSEINTASASDFDCISVSEGDQDTFVNEYREMKPSESLQKSRNLLTRHFQER